MSTNQDAVSPLRRRMIEDMTIRHLTAKTQDDYIRHVRAFAVFLRRSPDAPCGKEADLEKRRARVERVRHTARGSSLPRAVWRARASSLPPARMAWDLASNSSTSADIRALFSRNVTEWVETADWITEISGLEQMPSVGARPGLATGSFRTVREGGGCASR